MGNPSLPGEEPAEDAVEPEEPDPTGLDPASPVGQEEALREDLERAGPNPPLAPDQADPARQVDRGYMEDRDAERDQEELREAVEREATDPLEEEREAEEEPGPSAGPHPGQVP